MQQRQQLPLLQLLLLHLQQLLLLILLLLVFYIFVFTEITPEYARFPDRPTMKNLSTTSPHHPLNRTVP